MSKHFQILRKSITLCLFAGALFCSFSVLSVEFEQINVSNIITIDVPADWHKNDAKHRTSVTKISEQMMSGTDFETGQHVASLSIVSEAGTNWHGLIRASVMPIEHYSQHDFYMDYYLDNTGVLEEIKQVFKEEFVVMRERMGRQNQQVGPISVYYLDVDSMLAFAISYERGARNYPDSKMTVTQVHIPNGSIKLICTFTYRQAEEQNIKPILESVLSSIRFL